MSKTVALLGTLDTKGDEYAFVAQCLRAGGVQVLVIDAGVLGEPHMAADVSRAEVAEAGGGELSVLAAARDRGPALAVMARGATEMIRRLRRAGRIDGAMALGGTGGTSLARDRVPRPSFGFPQADRITAASGNTEMYVGQTDLILVPSIVDIAGLNRVSTAHSGNAAAAMAGMAQNRLPIGRRPSRWSRRACSGSRPHASTRARERLEGLGYEVLVFHMTGSGGQAMESLCRQGSSPECWTSRPPNWPTISSAACSTPGPIG